MGAFETQVAAELPLRIVGLKSSILGVTGDPNIAVNATLNDSPAGLTTFFDEDPRDLWFKEGPTSTDWVLVPTVVSGAGLPTDVWINRSTGDDANDGLSSGNAVLTDQAYVNIVLPPLLREVRNLSVEATNIVAHDVSPPGSYAVADFSIPSFITGAFAFIIKANEDVVYSSVVQTGATVLAAGFETHREVTITGAPFTPGELDDNSFLLTQDGAVADEDNALAVVSNTTGVITAVSRAGAITGDTETYDIVRPEIELSLTNGQIPFTQQGAGLVQLEGYKLAGPIAAFESASIGISNGTGSFRLVRCVLDDIGDAFLGLAAEQHKYGSVIWTASTNIAGVMGPAPFIGKSMRLILPSNSTEFRVEGVVGEMSLRNGTSVSSVAGNFEGLRVRDCPGRIRWRGLDMRGGDRIIMEGVARTDIRQVTVEGVGAFPCILIRNGTLVDQLIAVAGTTGNTDVGIEVGLNSAVILATGPGGRTMSGTAGDVRIGGKVAGPQTWATVEAGALTDYAEGDAALGATTRLT